MDRVRQPTPTRVKPADTDDGARGDSDPETPVVRELPQFSGPRGRPSFASGSEDTELYDRMSEVNRLYDRSDYEGALAQARSILEENPDNSRMLRILVSASCITGDEAQARAHIDKLPERDRNQMRKRCQRYGVEL